MRGQTKVVVLGGGNARAAITLVELLVAMGIVGILAAILIPAIQNSRGAARKVQCQSNLHQIGIATQNFIDANKRFPGGSAPLFELLSKIEQDELQQRLKEGGPLAGFPPGPSVYVCPDDRRANTAYRLLSYRMNDGNKYSDPNGVVNHHHPKYFTTPIDITDGLANTAMFSEKLIGVIPPIGYVDSAEPTEDEARKDPLRYEWQLPQSFAIGEEVAFAKMCLALSDHTGFTSNGDGYPYLMPPGAHEARYNHIVPPNHAGCRNEPLGSALPATSLHHGGVNVLMADGSAHFISEKIDLELWRALGSRDGGESVGEF